MRRGFVAIAAVAWSVLLLPGSAQTAKPRLAIQTFDNPSTSANTTLGNAVTDIFFTEVGRPGLFQLVERAALGELEREMGSSGDARRARAAADFMLLGKVTNFSFDEQSYQEQRASARGAVSQTMYRQNATVRIDFRVVSTATGVAVITESGLATESKVSATSEIETYRRLLRVGVFSAEATDSMIGRATIGAIRNAVRKITDLSRELTNGVAAGTTARPTPAADRSGHIIAEAGGGFIVDLGTDHGVQKGDRLRVFGKEVTKNNQGVVVYEQEVDIGVLEVVDVSMRDRAKAQLARSGASGARAPREGDVVRLDRGGAGGDRTDAVANASLGNPAAGGSADVQRLVRQGDRYVDDRYFAQAVDSYRKALAAQPASPGIMGKLVGALLYNKQLTDAEDMIDQLFSVNGSMSIGVVHNHTFGMCSGQLTISAGGIEYVPERGDHGFVARPAQIMGFDEGTVGTTTSSLPALTVRVRDAQNKDRKYDFIVPVYLSAKTITPLASPYDVFYGSEEALADTVRVHRMIGRLVQDKVGRR